MNIQSSLFQELNLLEQKIFETLTILPELTMRREAIRNRGPHLLAQFEELNACCNSFEIDLTNYLSRLQKCLLTLEWSKGAMPSPFYPELWLSWWNDAKAEARKRIASECLQLS